MRSVVVKEFGRFFFRVEKFSRSAKMEPEQSVGVKARTVLWYLTFFGFAINYMIRININIAVVDMISAEFKGKSVVMSECIQVVNASSETFYNVSEGHDVIVSEKTYISAEKRLLDFIGVRRKHLKSQRL